MRNNMLLVRMTDDEEHMLEIRRLARTCGLERAELETMWKLLEEET